MFQQKLALRALAAALLLPGLVYAQRGNDTPLPGMSNEISGQLRAPDRKMPLSSILIRLEASGVLVDQTAPDGNGIFRFARLKRDSYTVVLKLPGFKTVKQQVDLQAISKMHLLLDLVPEDAAKIDTGLRDARIPPAALKEYERGESDYQARKPARAAEHLTKAIEIYPDYFAAHLLLGAAYREMERWNEAEQALRRAIALQPKTMMALVELGEVHRRRKEYAEAEKVLTEALAIGESSWQVHFTLARVRWEMGAPEKAEPHVERAIALNPGYAEAHLLKGNVSMKLNKYNLALIEYDEYLRLAPKGAFAEQTREIAEKLRRALAARKPESNH
jgi:tetratricopeptide (TPR) repeat protein